MKKTCFRVVLASRMAIQNGSRLRQGENDILFSF